MSATTYVPDLRDLRFVLFEQLDLVGAMSAFPRYAELDRELCEQMVDEAARIAVEVLSPLNAPADRQGCSLDSEGNVTVPDGFKEAWNLLAEGGWFGLSSDEAYGGMQLPHLLDIAVQEVTTSACMAFATYPGLSRGAAHLLIDFAPQDIKELVCTKLITGEWSGSMCLTEAGAGSSVGDNRAKAERTEEPGVYRITGEKVFITAGDNDLVDNIVHLVLARTADAPAGTKGLSIFLVPKYEFDAEGKLGERNDVYVQSIEEKLGIHGSATCVLALGAKTGQGARGRLLGEEGQGMKIMFLMMNHARIGVGLQGLAGAAAAYNNALSYARGRIQGTSIKDYGKGEAAPVAIIEHPDVRRMLLWQKVHVETMRSFIYTLAMRLDRAELTDDEAERKRLMGLVNLMTPICKSLCSDRGFEVTVQAVQTFGGYGYIGEYPVEQHMRDTKIASIYEGTNGIQAMDLLGRKMRMGGGMVFMGWLQEAGEAVGLAKAKPELKEAAESVEKALNEVGAAAMHLGGLGGEGRLDAAMASATPYLEMMGTVVLGLHALWQGRVALEKLEGDVSEADRRFYRSKVAGARFYASQVLPKAVALGKSIRSGDESCLDEALFG